MILFSIRVHAQLSKYLSIIRKNPFLKELPKPIFIGRPSIQQETAVFALVTPTRVVDLYRYRWVLGLLGTVEGGREEWLHLKGRAGVLLLEV